MLFINVVEVLSGEFPAGVPWDDLYADDLVIIADSLEECAWRFLIWKEALEKEGLRVNARKDKGHNLWYRPGPLAEFKRIPMRCLLF